MLTHKGQIHYDDNDGHRITLVINGDFLNYYFVLIPSYLRPFKPRWPAHITVVRPEIDVPPKIRYWGDYEGEEVEFIYDTYILEGNGYYWINAWSKRLEEIRTELGLHNTSQYSLRPSGYDKTFHVTIGKYNEIFASGNSPEK
jgi:hypothetical protein